MRALKTFLAMGVAALALVSLSVAAQTKDAPRPLPKRESVKVSISAKIEVFAPLFVAQAFGEFEKENIGIETINATFANALVLLATGRADVSPGQPSAAFFNAVSQGAEVKMVAPGMMQPPASRQGIWLSRAYLAGRPYNPALLKGQTIASAVGLGTSSSYYIAAELAKARLTLNDVRFRQLSSPDILIALENGSVNAGVLVDPIWLRADDSKVAYAFGLTGDIAGGGWFFGRSMLTERRPVGEAFMRAIARATRTYLQGDYHKDEKLVTALSKELGIPAETLQRGASLVFEPDLNIRPKTASALQDVYMVTPGVLDYKTPLPEDRLIDRGFINAVNP